MPNDLQLLPGSPAQPARRDFIFIMTAAVAAVGSAVALWPFIDQMNPDTATVAAGTPVDIDISQLQPGQQVSVFWRGKPIFVVNRPKAALDTLRDPHLLAMLSDPNSVQTQQPSYATNWHRSIKPEFLVLVGICTHLGCIPQFRPAPDVNWFGGYFCPCHGSKYDLAGRVFSGVPAPYNLPVPPHHYLDDKTLRIGENPAGETFDFGSIDQV